MAPRAGLDREAVVQAAAHIADREGLESLTLAGVAAQLGVRTPSLYNHVDGLPGLRRELALRGLREINQRLGRAAVGKTGGPVVMAAAEALRSFIKEHPGLYAATVRSVHDRPDEDAALQVAAEETVSLMLAILASFGLSGEDALHAVRGLRSLVHGFATLEVSGGFGMPLDIDESFRRLVEMLVEGLERAQVA